MFDSQRDIFLFGMMFDKALICMQALRESRFTRKGKKVNGEMFILRLNDDMTTFSYQNGDEWVPYILTVEDLNSNDCFRVDWSIPLE